MRKEVHWDVHQGEAVREGLQTGQAGDHMKPEGMYKIAFYDIRVLL